MCCLSGHNMGKKESRVDVTDRPSSLTWAKVEPLTSQQLNCSFILFGLLLPAHNGRFVVLNMRWLPLGVVESFIHFHSHAGIFEFMKQRKWRWKGCSAESGEKLDFISVINLFAKSPVYRARIYIPIKSFYLFIPFFWHEHGINTIISSFTKKCNSNTIM